MCHITLQYIKGSKYFPKQILNLRTGIYFINRNISFERAKHVLRGGSCSERLGFFPDKFINQFASQTLVGSKKKFRFKNKFPTSLRHC
jgi:hypothetical protein